MQQLAQLSGYTDLLPSNVRLHLLSLNLEGVDHPGANFPMVLSSSLSGANEVYPGTSVEGLQVRGRLLSFVLVNRTGSADVEVWDWRVCRRVWVSVCIHSFIRTSSQPHPTAAASTLSSQGNLTRFVGRQIHRHFLQQEVQARGASLRTYRDRRLPVCG